MQTNKDLKQFQKDIEKAKAKCIKKFKEKGACENFGDKEWMELSDKWKFKNCAIDYATIHNGLVEFSDWANNYNGN